MFFQMILLFLPCTRVVVFNSVNDQVQMYNKLTFFCRVTINFVYMHMLAKNESLLSDGLGVRYLHYRIRVWLI